VSAATPLRELGRLVRLQWQTEQWAMSLAAEARSVREENERLRHRVLELEPLEPLAARVPELERYAGELAEGLREARESLRAVLSQRRVRLGVALARPIDLLRRFRR